MHDISIVIACRNGAATLADALDALVTQRCDRSWEIVLADNGSTDDTCAVFGRYAAANPQVAMRIVDASAEAGKSFALNTAIRSSQSRWFLFCDDDDQVAPGWLAAMAKALEQHPFVAARMDARTLNPDWTTIGRSRHFETGLQQLRHEPFCETAGGATLGFHRDVFEAAGGFDPAFAALEDTDFCIRAHLAGFRLRLVPDAVYIYRFRNDTRAIRRQAYAYAKHRALLRRRYARSGSALALDAWVPLVGRLGHLAAWRLARTVLPATNLRSLAWYNRQLGSNLGDLAGSLRFGVAPVRTQAKPEQPMLPEIAKNA